MNRFEGKIAVVTGGGRGIGEAVVRRLAAEGARVMATGPSDSVDRLAEELGASVFPYRCDVSEQSQVEAMIGACKARFGRLDLLCNNAGIVSKTGRLHECDVTVWDRVMAVNVRGAFLVQKCAIPLMLASGGGAIVNMGSWASLHPSTGTTPYAISKAAVLMMTRVAALEYAGDNIRVNCVAPGTITTPLLQKAGPEVIVEKIKLSPLGRIGTPGEVAAVTAFLLSDEAAFVTGAVYPLAGGREAI